MPLLPPLVAAPGRKVVADFSDGKPSYLLIGGGRPPLRLSASAYGLLAAVGSGLDLETLARELSRRRGRTVTAARLEASYRRLVDRLAQLSRSPGSALPSGFWLRLPLLSRRLVGRLAGLFAPLFRRRTSVVVAAGIVAAGAGFALAGAPPAAGAALGPAYLLFALSLFAHELGHAGASARYGVRPGEIGFTVYWVYPALYSDVTATWELRRWQRVVVDLGGVFIQLAVGAAYRALFLLTGWAPLELAFLAIVASCLASLNPVLRLDGYWALADALGVAHLGREPARILRWAARRLRGAADADLPHPRWVAAALVVYTPVCCGVWAWFFLRLAACAGEQLGRLPVELAALVERLAVQGRVDWGAAAELLVAAFVLLATGFAAWRLGARGVAGVARWAPRWRPAR